MRASEEVNDSSPPCRWFVDRIRAEALATINPAPMKSMGPRVALLFVFDFGLGTPDEAKGGDNSEYADG